MPRAGRAQRRLFFATRMVHWLASPVVINEYWRGFRKEDKKMPATVLIVDDDPLIRQALHLRLHAAGYNTVMAADGISAVQVAQRQRPDVILLDLGLPAGDGFTVMKQLRGITNVATVPIIIITSRDLTLYRQYALDAGAVAVLGKPFSDIELLATLAAYAPQILEPEDSRNKHILVVEDCPISRQVICTRLRAAGFETTEAADCVTAISAAVKCKPDLILLDLGLPGGDGLGLVDRFKAHPTLSIVPVVILSARCPEEYRIQAERAGVAAILEKPTRSGLLFDAIDTALRRGQG